MASGENDESFLTVAEVAETLRLNQQTVRNWIDAGSLPAVRVGRRVRIKRSDLDQIVERGYRSATAPSTSTPTGPNATDFWGGEPVGAAEPSSERSGSASAMASSAGRSDDSQPGGNR